MNDMQRDADRVGRRIWPDPDAVLERVAGGAGGGRANPGPRRSVLLGLATAAGLVAVLATALALRGSGNSTPSGAGALASSTSSPLATITPAPVTPAATSSGGSATATASTASGGTATVVPPGTPSPTSIPTPPSGGAVTLTAADSGRTISVHAGTSIVVTLSSTGGPYRWTEPDTSNAASVTRTGGAANPDGSASGTFTAVAAGNADLTAVDSPYCSPPCGAPSRLWKVSIVVTP